MSHSEVLARARQGEAAAIAFLINQALITRGIRVRAVRRTSCLHVMLEAAAVPARQIYGRAVYAAVFCLGAAAVETLQIYGRQTGVKSLAWAQVFRLPQKALAETAVGTSAIDSAASFPATLSDPAPTQTRLASYMRQILADSAAFGLSPRLALPLGLSLCAAVATGVGLSYLTVQTERTSPSSDAVQPTAPPVSPVSPIPAVIVPQPAKVAVTIKAVGDMIPGSNYPSRDLPTEVGEQLTAEREFLFGNIKPFLAQADILFGNFESTLTDHPDPAKDTSQGMTFAFRTPPAYAQMLKDLGFDVLSVANNHSFDFGDQGFADTIAHIENAGIKAVGQKGKIVYTTVNSIPIAFIGFSYLPDHNSMHDLEAAGALVQQAKQQAQIVVISVHAGAEGSDQVHVANQSEYFFGEDRGNLVAFAHSLIDQGADVILGHGPHVPRAIELYQDKLIAYSLGNFIGYKTLSTVGPLGYSLILDLQLDAAGSFVGGRVVPVALDNNGIPKLDDFFQSVVLVRNLIKTDFPQTPITIDDMGYIVRLDD